MITLEKLYQKKVKISDRTVDIITSCRSVKESNRKILDFLIINIKQDRHFLRFCDIMQTLVKVDQKTVVHAVRNGKVVCLCATTIC